MYVYGRALDVSARVSVHVPDNSRSMGHKLKIPKQSSSIDDARPGP